MVIRNLWLAVHGARVVGAPFTPYLARIYVPTALALGAVVLPLDRLSRSGALNGWAPLVLAGGAGFLGFAALAWALVLDRDDRARARALVAHAR
jgi:hypothetical protein